MPDKLRIGFIGAGGNTRLRHIPGLKAIADTEMIWVCNRSIESGQRVASEFAIEKVTRDPEDIFRDASVHAVCIGTWPYMHKDLTVRALNAGKHVLCEARMAMNAAEAREMLAASRAHPELVAQIVPAPFDFRCGPTITKLIREGYVGRPTDVVITVLNGQGLDANRTLQWRHREDYSGHNVMMMGIYAEVIQRWLGDTTRVSADARIFVDRRVDPDSGAETGVGIPDSITIAADMVNGARASYVISAVAPVAQRTSITVYGSEGVIAWEGGDRMSTAKLGGQLEPREPDGGLAGGWRVEQDFVDSIRDGKPVTLTNFEDGVRYMKFTDAVWRSWKEGRAVDVKGL